MMLFRLEKRGIYYYSFFNPKLEHVSKSHGEDFLTADSGLHLVRTEPGSSWVRHSNLVFKLLHIAQKPG